MTLRGRLAELMVLKDELSELQGRQGDLIVPSHLMPVEELACLWYVPKTFRDDLSAAGVPDFWADAFVAVGWKCPGFFSRHKTVIRKFPGGRRRPLVGRYSCKSVRVYHRPSLHWLLQKLGDSPEAHLRPVGAVAAVFGPSGKRFYWNEAVVGRCRNDNKK